MRILIGYAVYGRHPKYVQGAIQNARMRNHYLRVGLDLRQVFWLADDTPLWLGSILEDEGALIKRASLPSLPHPRFARLLTADLECDAFFIRDVDSRPSKRETNAMIHFFQTPITFHVMRDHPYHYDPVLTGMWGGLQAPFKLQPMWDRILHWGEFNKFSPDEIYGKDQRFLKAMVWPQMQQLGVLQHDTFAKFDGTVPFPDGDGGPEFVGEIFNEYGQPQQSDRDARAKALAERKSQ